jgi:hypothetical protein
VDKKRPANTINDLMWGIAQDSRLNTALPHIQCNKIFPPKTDAGNHKPTPNVHWGLLRYMGVKTVVQ